MITSLHWINIIQEKNYEGERLRRDGGITFEKAGMPEEAFFEMTEKVVEI